MKLDLNALTVRSFKTETESTIKGGKPYTKINCSSKGFICRDSDCQKNCSR